MLDSTADSLAGAGKKLGAFTGTLTDALNSGDMSAVKDVLSDNTDSLAAALAAPVKVKRNAVFPVKNFGSQMAPFYTILPLWVGSLLMAVTLKTTVSRKVRKELGDPKPHQLFLGHYGVFGVIGLLQSTFSLGGSLLFLHVQAVHPLLFMLSGWVSSLVFSFFTYTLVARQRRQSHRRAVSRHADLRSERRISAGRAAENHQRHQPVPACDAFNHSNARGDRRNLQ